MKTGLAVTAATLATLGLGAPALADSRWDRDDDRREWRDDRPHRHDDRRSRSNSYQQNQAYYQGYRDGWRAENRRDQRQQYRGNYGWQQPVYGNSYNNRYPTYRGATVQGSQPYWWGSNGQVHCRRQDGTTGLVVGALAGGTLGNMIAKQGDKTLGSVIGGTLGAVLGNEIAKGSARCR
ncbi:glycine zipper 2TM domain-containing protein [Sandaracinobacter neustonicus]|uniref:17 kDa surface antigen n=1 Tax=Sandaracinobacter neustonicus TaxID=1715348 RepID=A0A501XK76_9SPHN|nr:glycine zipper 2TM domain-containing protein [Sandaracinobacter neustonicus]TPE61088.1 glycine zipper 2TM domain-containing protein [Sandaracinobacter neustonicus]